MVYRELLIIHESAVIRGLLKSYILSELSDVKITEAINAGEAAKLIANKSFNVILSSQFLKKSSGIDLFQIAQKSQLNSTAAFVIVTSTETPRNIIEIKAKGIKNILVAPFEASDMRDLINAICDPKKLRTQNRFNIPGTTVSINLYNETVSADIVNISHKSILCEFSLKNHFIDVFKPLNVEVLFSAQYSNIIIKHVNCNILQYKALGMTENQIPEKVQLVLIINEMPQEEKDKWDETLLLIKKDFQKWSETSI